MRNGKLRGNDNQWSVDGKHSGTQITDSPLDFIKIKAVTAKLRKENFVSLNMPLTPEVRKDIFSTIKAALAKHSPPMVITKDKEDVFELSGNKPVPYGSSKKIVPGMYFSSVVKRKDMISFYFFPLYYHEKDYEKIIPTLKKSLKGKTCFNFKKGDQVDVRELDAMLKKGIQAWKKSGYMK